MNPGSRGEPIVIETSDSEDTWTDPFESIGEDIPGVREPDTLFSASLCYTDAPACARQVMKAIVEYNQVMGRGEENPYARPEVQAYTLVKTLPLNDPWRDLMEEYWKILDYYIPDRELRGSEIDYVTIDKKLIQWNVTVEEVYRRIQEVDRKGRKEGTIITYEEYKTRKMKEVEAQIDWENARMGGGNKNKEVPPKKRKFEDEAGPSRITKSRVEEVNQPEKDHKEIEYINISSDSEEIEEEDPEMEIEEVEIEDDGIEDQNIEGDEDIEDEISYSYEGSSSYDSDFKPGQIDSGSSSDSGYVRDTFRLD